MNQTLQLGPEEQNFERSQYNGFIEQLREEVRQLFSLYNFFLVIESAITGAAFTQDLSELSLRVVEFSGLLLALYWLLVMSLKNDWRSHWLMRVSYMEDKLGISDELRMWPTNPASPFAFRKRGLWNLLFLLPIGFIALWMILLIFLWGRVP